MPSWEEHREVAEAYFPQPNNIREPEQYYQMGGKHAASDRKNHQEACSEKDDCEDDDQESDGWRQEGYAQGRHSGGASKEGDGDP